MSAEFIIEEKKYYQLSDPTMEMIRVYGGGLCRVDDNGMMHWQIPMNRLKEVASAVSRDAKALPQPAKQGKEGE